MPAGVSRLVLVVIVAVIFAAGVALAMRFTDARRAPPIVIVDVAAERPVIVVVDGAVATPGVLTLPPGARLNDAVIAAGGFTGTADADELNLARLLDDGERITVAERPTAAAPGQDVAAITGDAAGPVELTTGGGDRVTTAETSLPAGSPTETVTPPAAPASRTASRPTPTLGSPADEEMIDINSASVGELDTLPGIGPVLAERIVSHRESNGPYATVDDLEAIDGISAGMVEELRPFIVAEPAPR